MKNFTDKKGRHVPLKVLIRALLTHPLSMIGIFFSLMGAVFLIVFAQVADLQSFRFSGGIHITEGTVERIEAQNATSNEQRIYGYHYTYPLPAGEDFSGISYTTGIVMAEGEKVEIEYLINEPEVSRIKGMKNNFFGAWILLIIAPFLILGLTFVAIRVIKVMSYFSDER